MLKQSENRPDPLSGEAASSDRSDLLPAAAIHDAVPSQTPVVDHSRILDSVGRAVIVTDALGSINYVNRFAEQPFGWSAAEMMGQNALELTVPKSGWGAAGAIMTRLQAGESWNGEIDLQHRTGRLFPALVTNSPLHDASGILTGVIGITTDLTEQKQAEERYRESEEMLQSVFDASRDGIVVEGDGVIVYINQAYLRQVGYAREELIGGDISRLVDPETAEKLMEYGRRRVRGEAAPSMYELTFKKKNGELVDVELSVSVSTVNTKKYVTTSVREISERKKSDSALRESEWEHREIAGHLESERARLTEAQALAKVGTWELDLIANKLSWSDENYKMFGMERDEFHGTFEAFLSCVHPDDREFVTTAYNKSLLDKSPYSIEHRLLMRDGQIKIVHESNGLLHAEPEEDCRCAYRHGDAGNERYGTDRGTPPD